MNKIIIKIQKACYSLLIALFTASMVTIVGFAGGPYTRSEGGSTSGNLWKYSGSQNKTTQSSGSCLGGYCAYLTQESLPQNQTIYAWNMGSTNVSNIYDWCAYIPSIATAAVRYDVFEKNQTWVWNVLVNQSNHQGQYVYLGYSDYPNQSPADTSKFPTLRNTCQSGYACDGRRVYFDTIKYSTYPTRDTGC